MTRIVLATLVFAITPSALAAPPVDSWVPGGTRLAAHGDDLHFKTPAGTVVEIELDRAGNPDEASGDALISGDLLTPGEGRLDLAAIAARSKALGLAPTGDWSLELEHGLWVYEIEGLMGDARWSVELDATSGEELRRKRD